MNAGWTLERLRATIGKAFSGLSGDLEGHRFWQHQREAITALSRHLSDTRADPRASVVIPTGGGKTSVFGSLVNSVAGRKGQADAAPRIVMLVPSLPLVAQVLMEFRTRHEEVDIGYLASRTVIDKEGHAYRQGRRPTTVMSYALFMRQVASGELSGDDVDLIVLDEAHRGLSDLRRGVFEDLFPSTMVVAFSATPAFDEERSLNGLMGRDNLVYTADPQRLRDEGILAPVANYVLAVRIEGDLPVDPLERQLVRRKAHADEILTFLERHVDAETGIRPLDKVTVFYGSDRAHAALFAREYNARFEAIGKRMEVLTGEDGPERLQAVVGAIERGEVTGIANAQLLVEGFDLAKIGLVINSPTESLVKVIQQAGRAQRIDWSMRADDIRQTAFVLDTYLEVSGRIEGSPRWYFEAANEISRAYAVTGRPVRADAIDVSAYLADPETRPDAPDGEPGAAGAEPALAEGESPSPEPRAEDPHPAPVTTGTPERERQGGTDAPGTGDDAGWPAWDPDGADGDEPDGYRSSAAVTAIRYLLRKRSLGRLVEDKTEAWLARSEILPNLPGSSYETFFDELEKEFLEKRLALSEEPVSRAYVAGERRSSPVTLRMALLRSGAKPTVCYHVDCVEDLIRVSGAPMRGRTGGPEWISRNDLVDAVGAAWTETNELLKRTLAAFQVEERLDAEARGVAVDGAFVRMRRIRSEGGSAVTYHRDEVAKVASLVGVLHGRREDGDIPLAEAAARLGLARNNPALRQAFDTLRAQAEAGEETRIDGIPVHARLRYSKGRLLPHLVGDAAVEALSMAIDAPSLPRREDRWADREDLPARTEAWLTRDEAFARLRTAYRAGAPLGALWDRLTEAEEVDGTREVAEGVFRFSLMRSYNRNAQCLHADDLEAFRSAAADPLAPIPVDGIDDAEHQEGWYSLNKAAPYLGMAPTSPALARAWGELAERLAATGEATLDARRLDMRIMRIRGGYAPCLPQADLDWLGLRLNPGRDPALQPAGPGDMDRTAVARALGMKPTAGRFLQAWNALERDLAAGVGLDGVHARHTSHRRALVITSGSLQAFAERAGFVGVAPGHLDPQEVHARLRDDLGTFGIDRFRAIWDGLSEEQGDPAPTYRMVRFTAGKRSGWALAESDYPRLRDRLRPPALPDTPPPQVPDEDWSLDWIAFDVALTTLGGQRYGAAAKHLAETILARQEEIGPVPAGHVTGISWNGVRVPLRRIDGRGAIRYALARLALPGLVPHLSPPTDVAGDWKPLSPFAGVTYANHGRPFLDDVRAEVEALPASERGDATVTRTPVLLGESFGDLPPVEAVPVRLRVGLRRSGNINSVQVHRDSWTDLARLTGQNLPTLDPAPGYVTREEAFRRIGVTSNAKVDEVFRSAMNAHAATLRLTGEHRPVTLEGTTIRCRRVPGGKGAATLFHEDDVPAVAALAGYGPGKTEEWLERVAAASACRVNARTNPTFREFWDGLVADHAANRPSVLAGRALRIETRRSGSARIPCLHRDEIPHLIETLGFVTEDKTDDWVDKLRAASAIGTAMSNPRFEAAWNGLMAMREACHPTSLDGKPVTFRRVIAGSRTPYCIRREDLGTLAEAIGVSSHATGPKTPDWITEREFCDTHRTNQQDQPVINPLWIDFRDAAREGRPMHLSGGTPRLAILRHGAHDVACIHAGDLPLLRSHLGISPPATAEEIAADWRPRGAVAAEVDEHARAALDAAWSSLARTVVADPSSGPDGVRLRVDINGAGLLMRVHKDDVEAMAEWATASVDHGMLAAS
jgi:superfamily II DNA or RNA helicase